jgi:UDP-N-acetylmuramoyl-L-alanyl-D-glutamate--2,6-diaminopimelate ligase
MPLKQLVDELAPVKVEGSLDREIAGLAYDSRRVTPGMVFVAIPGLKTDGHEYISTAIDRGAAAVICEQNGFVSQRATKIRVADAREALAVAAAAFYQHPSRRLQMVGVTGTNGKTTVSFMVKRILEEAGVSCGLIGTVRYEIGERIIPAQRTTPEALEIQQMLAQMLRADCRACVMEVSSHALAQRRVCGVQFDAGVFTNLTQDHLDYHHTMESYFQTKRELFALLEAGTKPSAAIINVDDPFGARLAQDAKAGRLLTYGFGDAAQVRATRIKLRADFTEAVVVTPRGTFDCRLPLIGRHNVYNALAAVGAALALQIEPERIRTALASIKSVPGRLEAIAGGQPFALFVDYAHTDDALRNVLTTLREITSGRLLLAFGCGGNRDPGKRPLMGRVAAELADYTIITSDNPRRESPDHIAAAIEAGYRSARPAGYRVELDRKRAIDEIIRAARPEDTVLIAGKGHETYQEFEDTVIPFDDRLHARDTLEALGWKGGD